MKRLRLILPLLVAVALNASAQLTARQAFVDAPRDVFMLLEKNDRLDMLDYFDSNQSRPVSNSFEGSSSITALDDRSMTIAMTPSSTCQLVVLPGSRPMLMLITTMATPARDSRVKFYTPDWKEVDASRYLPEQSLDDWLNADGKKNRDLVESVVPFIMAEAVYDPKDSTLRFTNNLASFLSPDMYDMIAPYMHPVLVYKWNGKKMVKEQ